MTEQVWLQAKQAVEYYGISLSTLHNWRRLGRFTIKDDTSNSRGGYLYLQDESLKNTILNMKPFDKRWT